MPDLIQLRERLCRLEQTFAADIRSPAWEGVRHDLKDARARMVGEARRELQAAERAERKAGEVAGV
jgi:hypothetical protein